MKILVVCLGNICRSPMAEGLLRDHFENAGLDIEVDSAGTSNYHIGETPDPRAIENMKQNGHDISNLRGRQFKVEDFDRFDRIYAMDRSNYHNILRLARDGNDENKVELFLNLSAPNSNSEVPDPYYGGDGGFQHVYELLEAATNSLVDEFRS